MFKKVFVIVLSLSVSSIIASQKPELNLRFDLSKFDFNRIEDLHSYIEEIETKLVDDCKDEASISKEIMDGTRKLKVYCFCKENGPLLIDMSLENKETGFNDAYIEKSTNANDVNTTETYYTYYDSKNLKSSTTIKAYRNDKKGIKYKIENILREEYTDATNKKILKEITVKPKENYDYIKERSFEYYADNDKIKVKEMVVVIEGSARTETLFEYDRTGTTIRETRTDYTNGIPSKRSVTDYDGANKVILSVVVYEYNESGLEKFKTVEKYKNGKLASSKYFELIYNSEGKLEKEKPAKKK